MRIYLYLLFLIFYAAVLHFLQIDKIPPLLPSSQLGLRYLSALLSLGSILVFYLYVKNLLKNKKIALLSSWILTILPWTIEQSRIYSQINIALSVFLIFIFLLNKLNNLIFKILIFVICYLLFVFVYPQFWVFRDSSNTLLKVDYLNNIFFLLSTTFLFLKNITFWWGGVRDFGVMYISFLPLFMIGIYQTIILRKYQVLIWFGLILLVSLMSPFLPESREFFLICPFLSIMLGLGMAKLKEKRFLFLLISIFLLYEMFQFFHFYTIHYPLQIRGGIDHINETLL